MATFQVSYVGPTSAFNNEGASTSYIHRSGHAQHRVGRGRDEEQGMYDADEEDGGDEDGLGDVAMQGVGDMDGARLATTGQAIASATTFMRGHGAYLSNAAAATTGSSTNADASPIIRSSLCGVVRKTNKLISVSSLKTRYAPEVGDLVVGRIADVQPGNRRWKVDIQARQEANLMLSSINLPGGIQRRKLESDELEMRTFFKEGDLLVCEVQSLFHDGSTSLHTRSLNYGKLRNGHLAIVNPCLIRRLKSHFVRFDALGLEVIVGLNGAIWVSMLDTGKVNITTGTGRDIEAVYSDKNDVVPFGVRQRISRMLDLISLFSYHHSPISDVALELAFDTSIQLAPLDSSEEEEQMAPNGFESSILTQAVANAILEQVRQALD